MLGKIIKYDIRALSKVLILVQLPIFALTLVARYIVIPELSQNGPDILSISGLAAYVLYISAAATLTELYLAYYVYKNLFSDQGYLTLTLPVSPGTHLLGKMVSCGFWIAADSILLFLSALFLIFTPEVQGFLQTPDGQDFIAGFFHSMGSSSPQTFLYWMMFLIGLGILTGPLMIIGSLCFGQLFSSHRILWAVIFYTIFTIITGLFSASFSFRAVYRGNGRLPGSYFNELMVYTTILSVIFTAVCGILSYWVLKKKINLH